MALKDYLPGIMGSIENISRNLAMMERLEIEGDKLTFDYAINKAKIEAENKRYGIELGFKERAETRADKQLSIEEKRAGAYNKYMGALTKTAEAQGDIAKKNLDTFDERYQDEQRLKQLQIDVAEGRLSTQAFERKLKEYQFQKAKDMDEYNKAVSMLQSEVFRQKAEADKRASKRYRDVYAKEIHDLDKPSTWKTVMSPFRELGVGLTAGFSDESKAEVRKRWAKEKKLDYIVKKMPFIIQHEEQAKSYEKLSNIYDKVMANYKGSIPIPKESVIGQYPVLEAPTEYPDFMKEIMEESLYDFLGYTPTAPTQGSKGGAMGGAG